MKAPRERRRGTRGPRQTASTQDGVDDGTLRQAAWGTKRRDPQSDDLSQGMDKVWVWHRNCVLGSGFLLRAANSDWKLYLM